MDKELKKRLDDLEKRVNNIDNKRIFQQDIVPGAIKGRHIGEGPWFVRSGIAGNKPTIGESGTDSAAIYYDETAHKLWIYDNGTWRYASFT